MGVDHAGARVRAHPGRADMMAAVCSVASHFELYRGRIIVQSTDPGEFEILCEQREGARDGIDIIARVAPIDVNARNAQGIAMRRQAYPAGPVRLLLGVEVETVEIGLRLDDDRRKLALRELSIP